MAELAFTDFNAPLSQAQVALYGIPFEGQVNLRKGAHLGPTEVRRASHFIETYSPALRKDLEDLRLYDGGDLDLTGRTIAEVMDQVADQVAERVPRGVRPCFLGGDHTVTYPVLKALARRRPELRVVQIDAHPDLRAEFLGERYNYASAMARVIEVIPPEHLFQLGLRTGAREEYAEPRRTHCFPVAEVPFLEAVARTAETVRGFPVYVTIDIDALDPALAPGTGSPEPAGLTVQELLASIRAFAGAEVVGFDLVEVSPPFDSDGRTAILAACLVRDCILHWWA